MFAITKINVLRSVETNLLRDIVPFCNVRSFYKNVECCSEKIVSSDGGKSNLSSSSVESTTSVVPVKLAYTSYESTKTVLDPNPVIIMHGLLGSKTNWNSLSKAIHNKTNKKVISVDARNHGESPHTPELSYEHLAADVRALVEDLSLSNAVMIGHSMGGRAMMLVALKYPELLQKLIVVDISPIGTSPGLKYMLKYIEAMRLVHIEPNLPLSAAHKSADSQLAKYISDRGLRQFLVTNLVESGNGEYKWRVNLDSIINNFTSNISTFPPVGSSTFTGPTLFIGGTKSDYLKKDDQPDIKKLFSNAQFEFIDGAGHWLHAEKPQEFLDIVVRFITS